MKKIVALILAQLLLASSAFAIDFTFSDQDFLSGASWGTMGITASATNVLKIQYAASNSPPIPADAEATGFGFSFSLGTLSGISNPGDGDFLNDRNDLNWIEYNGDGSTFPGVANGDEFTPAITKADYVFGVTEGNANNFNPPGILPGQLDIFYLTFDGLGALDLLQADLVDFVDLTGVRLQSLPNDINTGSLFLAGRYDDDGGEDEIPEPSTLVLLGLGLVGLAAYRRKKH